jgi:uncharacterized membrane-anchored protein YhcB (DUF1043 family)
MAVFDAILLNLLRMNGSGAGARSSACRLHLGSESSTMAAHAGRAILLTATRTESWLMVMLDGTTSMWVVGILSFLLGGGIGCIFAYLVFARNGRTRELQLELTQLTERFTDYRDQVTQHFMRTSELVQEMTHSYRSVYEHLASGAQYLCGEQPEITSIGHREADQLAAAGTASAMADTDTGYDELAELSSIKHDIDELLGEAPRISDLDIDLETGEQKPLQH